MSNLFNAAVANLVTPQKRLDITAGNVWPSLFPFNLTEGAKKVNVHSSLTISAFYCGVNAIANSYALLPESVMIKTGKVRTHLPDHPADYLLHDEPNDYMTAFDFKFIMVVSVLMKGNAFALIRRDNSGNVAAYIFLQHDDVTVIENNGKLFYKHKGKTYSADEIIHVRGFSFDGISGRSILQFAADNLGVSLAAQKFGSESLTDRGLGLGVLESEKDVKKEKKEEISNAFESRLGSGGRFRAPLLDEGMKYKGITLSPQEARFIETYASGIEDVARWLNIPSYKLHIKGEGGYNFIVQMSIEYIQTAIMPIAEKMKQEKQRKTFTRSEVKKGIYIFQNYKKLLQADPKARGQFYKDLVFVRAINPNEIRELEDMNPVDGGDEFLQMSNLLNEQQVKKQITDEN